MFNKDFIYRKISLIQEDLAKLEELAKFSFEEIASDFYKQNTLERLLEKIIVRAIDINEYLLSEFTAKDTIVPKTYKETFTELAKTGVYSEEFGEQISKSVGTRNVLVHEYDEEVDDSKVYSSISDCLRDYAKYCGYILKFLEKF
jgi:uncharacterized protein YutE (UPF0331/DUF86 family)